MKWRRKNSGNLKVKSGKDVGNKSNQRSFIQSVIIKLSRSMKELKTLFNALFFLNFTFFDLSSRYLRGKGTKCPLRCRRVDKISSEVVA